MAYNHNFWDDRFSADEYIYGVQPNRYFQKQLQALKNIGKALFVGAGEGRNAVYAANCGWDVVAVDTSQVACDKAKQLAKENGVHIDYKVGTINALDLSDESFDLLVFIHAHFEPKYRAFIHQEAIRKLKKGGLLILEGFSKNHLKYRLENPSVGGPGKEAYLYDEELLRADFQDINFEFCREIERDFNEGSGHNGLGKVWQVFGQKV